MTDHTKKFKKVNVLSPEDIVPNKYYTLTINPCDDFQYFKNNNRLENFTLYIKQQMRQLVNVCDIDLYIEVSRAGRLHGHGTVQFKTNQSIADFYLNHVHRILRANQIEIDTLSDVEDWSEYCQKSQHLIKLRIQTKDVLKLQLKEVGIINNVKYKIFELEDESYYENTDSKSQDKHKKDVFES